MIDHPTAPLGRLPAHPQRLASAQVPSACPPAAHRCRACSMCGGLEHRLEQAGAAASSPRLGGSAGVRHRHGRRLRGRPPGAPRGRRSIAASWPAEPLARRAAAPRAVPWGAQALQRDGPSRLGSRRLTGAIAA
ncbi:hypothetical protein QJS66_17130 [Kocuria rhizophila]|nr:hypothetical protein QJS66_17130 [Kocuria rhizophila]